MASVRSKWTQQSWPSEEITTQSGAQLNKSVDGFNCG